jgi:hypothetical protein
MFAQIIRAKVSDPELVEPVVDRWMTELAPGATGWLGSTSGVTDDGDLFVLVRFDSEESARSNSDRPEQGAWWAELEALLDGEAQFRDSTDVEIESVGDLDSAGFVQVILAKSRDLDRSKALMNSDLNQRAQARPDILGSVGVGQPDGEFAYVIYFTSEADARLGEQKEVPPEVQAAMQEMMALGERPPEYLDLKRPRLDSPS